ncbi:MAG: dipeptidase [Candidatus Tectomicrobia bacterium]|nr:dipeptidase [Candidatus Tectomicrobia bacterium]
MVQDILDAVESQREAALEELAAFLRIPSVSADPQCAPEVRRCAEHAAERLRAAGLTAEVHPTPGHPAVLAERIEDPSLPTVLIYGHYDVQPPDPLDLWETDPFDPTVRGGYLFARGAHDNKGQIFCHLKAVEAFHRVRGRLPLNVKFLIEGEEEIGSPSLDGLMRAQAGRLKADYAVVSDTSQFAERIPAIMYGLRGLSYLEVVLTGPDRDLHSGGYGGSVDNPANVLLRVLASLRDEDGKVAIPGFYDDVAPLEDWEREAFAALPFDEAEYRRSIGVPALAGEKGFSTLERRWARPTLDVNGVYGGYQGPGAKTIIPSRAGAKVSMRLVPNQDPNRINDLFETAVRERLPRTVRVEITRYWGSRAVLIDAHSRGMEAARSALKKGFGRPPVLIREGGTIPVVASLQDILGLDSLLVPFGGHDDRTHSPNERMPLENIHRGVLTACHLLHELSRI